MFSQLNLFKMSCFISPLLPPVPAFLRPVAGVEVFKDFYIKVLFFFMSDVSGTFISRLFKYFFWDGHMNRLSELGTELAFEQNCRKHMHGK